MVITGGSYWPVYLYIFYNHQSYSNQKKRLFSFVTPILTSLLANVATLASLFLSAPVEPELSDCDQCTSLCTKTPLVCFHYRLMFHLPTKPSFTSGPSLCLQSSHHVCAVMTVSHHTAYSQLASVKWWHQRARWAISVAFPDYMLIQAKLRPAVLSYFAHVLDVNKSSRCQETGWLANAEISVIY